MSPSSNVWTLIPGRFWVSKCPPAEREGHEETCQANTSGNSTAQRELLAPALRGVTPGKETESSGTLRENRSSRRKPSASASWRRFNESRSWLRCFRFKQKPTKKFTEWAGQKSTSNLLATECVFPKFSNLLTVLAGLRHALPRLAASRGQVGMMFNERTCNVTDVETNASN